MIKEKKIILGRGEICDHCLGRLFKQLFDQIPTVNIGAAVRKGKTDKEIQKIASKKLSHYETDKCFVCEGLFQRIDDAVELILGKMDEYEFDTFLVGVVIPKKIQAKEEELWSLIGGKDVEPIKRELNRILRDKIQKKSGKKINFDYPNIILLADFLKNRILVQINSLYIGGKYKKLKRGIPQTRWPTKEFPFSIEQYVLEPMLKAAQATKEKFHGQGREDIDALMLGTGRGFVAELLDPKKRKLDLKKIQNKINKDNKGKIEVSELKFVTKEKVKEIKSSKFDKTYRCLIETEKKIDKDKLKDLEKFFLEQEIIQETPQRSLGHRADKKRKRKIKKLKVKYISSKKFEINVSAEAGTYIKELISGDEGRTKPSITKQLKNKCKCIELDVLKIGN